MESNHSSEDELDEIIRSEPTRARLHSDESDNQLQIDSERSSSSKTSCSTMSTSSLQLRAASSGVDSEVQRTPPNAAAGPTNMLVRPTSRTILRSPLRARSAEEGRRSRSLSSAGPSPVQFSATPPAHAKKPRRSVSPPRTRHHLPPRPSAPAPSSRRSSRAFCDTTTDHHAHDDGLPPLPPTAVATTTYTATAALTSNRNHHNTLDRGGGGSENKKKSLLPATRKRPRHSSRSNQTQRPCLDFEKMQQLKTQAVTSWRHGGEVSLFCW